jgi:hypothetical protein
MLTEMNLSKKVLIFALTYLAGIGFRLPIIATLEKDLRARV